MAKYSIKDLERLSGIKAHTIRIWEKRYKLIEPSRTSTNIRFYSDSDLKRILNISILNKNGFKISKIAQLSYEELHKHVLEVCADTSDFASQIENLVLAMVDLNEEKFEKIFSGIILRNGFEDSIVKIIYPFFEKIGYLWQTGAINPIQEHFVSNIIRQKLIVAIDSQIVALEDGAKSFTLFLAEDELHEIGLLFYNYLIKKAGHKVVYFGQSVPYGDIIEASEIRPCDYYLTSFVASLSENNLTQYLTNLSNDLNNFQIIISGFQSIDLDVSGFKNVRKFNRIEEFADLLNSI
jgi:MerR family transcriptional regulator, light-induced transcriptional regulator